MQITTKYHLKIWKFMAKRPSRIACRIVCLVTSLFSPLHLPAGQTLGGVVLTEVTPRIVTPNGDLLNDVIFFKFDSALSGLPVESSILDVNGARVSGMSLNSNETSLLWDGKDEGGRSLPSGVYIYSIKIGKNQATGTVVVAR